MYSYVFIQPRDQKSDANLFCKSVLLRPLHVKSWSLTLRVVISDSFFETADSFCMSSSSSWCFHPEARYMLKKEQSPAGIPCQQCRETWPAIDDELSVREKHALFFKNQIFLVVQPWQGPQPQQRSSQSIPGEAFQRCAGGFRVSRRKAQQQTMCFCWHWCLLDLLLIQVIESNYWYLNIWIFPQG